MDDFEDYYKNIRELNEIVNACPKSIKKLFVQDLADLADNYIANTAISNISFFKK